MAKSFWSNPLALTILFFLILLPLKPDVLGLPYHWDALGYVVPYARDVGEGMLVSVNSYSSEHPPGYPIILAGAWKVFGESLLTSHLVGLFSAAICLAYTHLLARKVYGLRAGIIAPALLLFTPLFFAQSGTLHLEVPAAALAAAFAHYFVAADNRRSIYAGILLVMVKESGVLFLFSAFAASAALSGGKFSARLRDSLKFLAPMVFLAFWSLIHYLEKGWFLNARNELLIRGAGLRFTSSLFRLFVYDHTVTALTRTNWILSIMVFFAAAAGGLGAGRRKRFIVFASTAVFINVLFFSFFAELSRYYLPIMPFFFILSAGAISRLFGRHCWPFLLVLVLFTTQGFYGSRTAPGHILESNMEYRDLVVVHRQAIGYVEDKYPGRLVVTGWPMAYAVRNPQNGYVAEPMDYCWLKYRIGGCRRLRSGDVILYSPQSDTPWLLEMVEEPVRHVRTFEVNGKMAKAYVVVPS